MNKTSKFLFVFVMIISAWSMTAQKTITGTVTSISDGGTLPGVAVILQEDTAVGTLTDFDGNYSIEAAEGQTLQFSFLGMKTASVTVGSSDVIDMALEDDAAQLDEVVVTALGIKRAEKTLTYAQQTVGGDELTKTRDVNFVNSLSGKAAGVEIRKSGSGPGGSTKIQIRGSKSLSGDSSPLIVIDGIPMVNNRGSQPGLWNGVDGGDGLSALNPDDIESISILRGANAAILYGSQGANGVIIVTTKSGREGTATVQVNSGITFESIIETPELQYRYGSLNGAKESWDYTQGNYDDSFVEDWFQTGVNYLNAVSVSGGNAQTQAYFSYANTSSTGVTENNSYLKNNFTFKQSTFLFDEKVKVTSNIIMSQEKTRNRNRAGYYINPLTGLYWFPRDRNVADFRDDWREDVVERGTYKQNWFLDDHLQSNPWWIINEQPREDKINRVIASANVEYNIDEHFKIQVRGNYDFAAKEYEQQHHSGSNTTNVPSNGRWEFQDYTDTSIYFDAIGSYTNNFGDFSLNAIAGGSYQKTTFFDGVSVDTGTTGVLTFANEFYFQNVPSNVQIRSRLNEKKVKQSMFGNITLGFKEFLFLDVAGRNDWASTLAGTGNDSYFYPSFGLTFILSEMIELPDAISFAKFRGSWAQVGNEIPYNRISPSHSINASGAVNFNTTAPFDNLKPEIISTFEIGLDWRFFSNRLGIDFTYYDINSQDQYINLAAPSGSEFTRFFVNAGEITNKGVEMTLNGKPVVTEDFTWSTAINYSQNTNEIVELHEDVADIGQGGSEGIRVLIVEGGSIGDIYAFKFQRDDQGRIILDDTSGRPLRTNDRELSGNSEPDYIVGWNNNMYYKNWSLGFQINGKFGGITVSQTEALLDGYGVSERSAAARDRGFENINAVQNGQPVSQIDPFTYYDAIGGRNGIDEPHIYDRTSIRLAQLALSYSFNVQDVKWLNNASLSFIGNNLFFFYKDAPYDPEISVGTGRNNPGIDSFNLPSTRTYGLNLSLTF